MFQPIICDVTVALSHRLSSSPLTPAEWASPPPSQIHYWLASRGVDLAMVGGRRGSDGSNGGRCSAAVRSAAVADPTVENGAAMDPVGRHIGVGSCSPSRVAMAMITSHRGDGRDRPNSPFLSHMDPVALCLARRPGGGWWERWQWLWAIMRTAASASSNDISTHMQNLIYGFGIYGFLFFPFRVRIIYAPTSKILFSHVGAPPTCKNHYFRKPSWSDGQPNRTKKICFDPMKNAFYIS